MGIILGRTSTLACSFEKQFDADGKCWMFAQAHGALTANTPYAIIANELGPITRALADETIYCYIGVPAKDYASGAIAKLQIGGRVTAMITGSLSVAVGHGLSILDGAVADVGADYSGLAGQFASQITASTTATTQDCMLVPERILTTT